MHTGPYAEPVSSDIRGITGKAGELAAARFLRRRGYRIVDRNFRTRFGELDLVATKRNALVFCEVKTRTSPAIESRAPPTFHPFDSVGGAKQRKLRRLASAWLAARSGSLKPQPQEIRFDVIGVLLTPRGRVARLDHLPRAFD